MLSHHCRLRSEQVKAWFLRMVWIGKWWRPRHSLVVCSRRIMRTMKFFKEVAKGSVYRNITCFRVNSLTSIPGTDPKRTWQLLYTCEHEAFPPFSFCTVLNALINSITCSLKSLLQLHVRQGSRLIHIKAMEQSLQKKNQPIFRN